MLRFHELTVDIAPSILYRMRCLFIWMLIHTELAANFIPFEFHLQRTSVICVHARCELWRIRIQNVYSALTKRLIGLNGLQSAKYIRQIIFLIDFLFWTNFQILEKWTHNQFHRRCSAFILIKSKISQYFNFFVLLSLRNKFNQYFIWLFSQLPSMVTKSANWMNTR